MRSTWTATMPLLLNVLILIISSANSATIIVGNGTRTSCTYTALQNAISAASSGDTINFDCTTSSTISECDIDPITIKLNGAIWIEKSLTINGKINPLTSNTKIILDGQGLYRQFIIANSNTYWGISGENIIFSLSNMILLNGATPISTNELQMNCRPNWGNPVTNCYTQKGEGGCIYIGRKGSATISNVEFNNCNCIGTPNGYDEPLDTSYNGGAIYINPESYLYIEDSTFCNSYATQQGGAIYAAWQTVILDIDNCIFYNNIAGGDQEQGGGAIMVHDSETIIDNSIFAYNKGHLGGAIRNLLSDLTISNSIFINNQAIVSNNCVYGNGNPCARGGAIYIDGGPIDISTSLFEDNISGGRGGAVYACLYSGENSFVKNTEFISNIIGPEFSDDIATGAGLHLDCGATLTFNNVLMEKNKVNKTMDSWSQYLEQFGEYNSYYSFINSNIPGWDDASSNIVTTNNLAFNMGMIQCGAECDIITTTTTTTSTTTTELPDNEETTATQLSDGSTTESVDVISSTMTGSLSASTTEWSMMNTNAVKSSSLTTTILTDTDKEIDNSVIDVSNHVNMLQIIWSLIIVNAVLSFI